MRKNCGRNDSCVAIRLAKPLQLQVGKFNRNDQKHFDMGQFFNLMSYNSDFCCIQFYFYLNRKL